MGDYLIHYGVKGMKWGVRNEKESSGQKHQGMSTAKKVAIGVGVAAAVAGVTYISVKAYKTSKHNKMAKAAVDRVIRTASNTKRSPKIKELGYVGRTERYRQKYGHYNHNFKRQRRKALTGHSSERLTKYGAARYKTNFYKKTMDNALYGYGNRSMYPVYEDRYRTSSERMASIVTANGGKTPAIRSSNNLNKLTRKKKFKVIG